MVGLVKGLACGCCGNPCGYGNPTEWDDDFSSNTISDYVVRESTPGLVSITGGKLLIDCAGISTHAGSSAIQFGYAEKYFDWHLADNPVLTYKLKFYITPSTNLESPGNTFLGPVSPEHAAAFGLLYIAGAGCTITKQLRINPVVYTNTIGYAIELQNGGRKSAQQPGPIPQGTEFEIEVTNVGIVGDFYKNSVKIKRDGVVVLKTDDTDDSTYNFLKRGNKTQWACNMKSWANMTHNSSVDPDGRNEYDDWIISQT